jgi:hypothetical protein
MLKGADLVAIVPPWYYKDYTVIETIWLRLYQPQPVLLPQLLQV